MITLSLEAGILGGSLSLLKNGREIDFRIGNRKVSKAEDILEQISELLKNNAIKKVDLIVVSGGPGSSTGIRIGWATALGLKKPFGCRIAKVPLFEALMLNKTFDKPTLFAVPVGGKYIAWKLFTADMSCSEHFPSEIQIGDNNLFLKFLKGRKNTNITLHSELIELVLKGNQTIQPDRLQIMNDNLALPVGLRGIEIISDEVNASDNEIII